MRVAIADDSIFFREGLARLLEDRGLEVGIQASSGDELLTLARHEPPDLAILDIRMPPTHTSEGLTTARHLRQHHPNTGILVLSVYAETAYAAEVLDIDEKGIGYLIKDRVNNVQELTDAMSRIGRGELVMDPGIVHRLLKRTRTTNTLERLSERAREVLELMAEGRSNQSIAEELCIQLKTVEHHIATIFSTLELDSNPHSNRRVLAVLTWLRQGV